MWILGVMVLSVMILAVIMEAKRLASVSDAEEEDGIEYSRGGAIEPTGSNVTPDVQRRYQVRSF
jgi:hypothetical protein